MAHRLTKKEEGSMRRSPIEELRDSEGAKADPGTLSSTFSQLIHASREFEAKIYDSDPETGAYVVVLEGILEVPGRERPAEPDGYDDRPQYVSSGDLDDRDAPAEPLAAEVWSGASRDGNSRITED